MKRPENAGGKFRGHDGEGPVPQARRGERSDKQSKRRGGCGERKFFTDFEIGLKINSNLAQVRGMT